MRSLGTTVACVVTLALTGTPAHASIAAEPTEPAEAKPKVALEIDTTKLDSTAKLIDKRVSFQARERASQAGVEIVAGSSAVLRVVVWPSGTKKDGYEFEVVPLLAGEKVKAPDGSGLCSPCMPEELAKAVDGQLPAQLAALKAAMNEPPPPVVADGPGPVPAPADGVTPEIDDAPKRRPLGAMGWAGIGVGLAGIAPLVAGIVFATREPEAELADDIESESGTDVRKPMIAVAAVGGAMVVTGIVLLAVDRAKAKRRTTALAPMMLPRGAGVSMGMRF